MVSAITFARALKSVAWTLLQIWSTTWGRFTLGANAGSRSPPRYRFCVMTLNVLGPAGGGAGAGVLSFPHPASATAIATARRTVRDRRMWTPPWGARVGASYDLRPVRARDTEEPVFWRCRRARVPDIAS